MAGETREQFIGRVRRALRDRGPAVPLPDDLEIARVIGTAGDPVAVFIERVIQGAMHPYRVADEAAMIEQVCAIVEGVQAQSVMMPAEDFPGREALTARLREKGLRFGNPDHLDDMFTCDVGITGVRAAIAETASVCLSSGGPRRRLASLAVPVHIAILRAEQIMPDLLDWAADLPNHLAASEVLVSGPSKTADIEMNLVKGVHGPREEHFIIIG